MSRFRLFGRSTGPATPAPPHAPAPPRAGVAASWRPSATLFGASPAARSPAADPDTDPYGLAAVRPSVFT
ncbi:MAG: hypothetical protein L0H84_13530, partial [Pseudonocardia sp.]|nr:hypothetical protein [Pseudonocardia sp.]